MDELEGAAREICARLRGAGHRALLAGGCVRDMILGVAPKDYDIATSARPGEIAGLFDHTLAVGAAFGVMIAVVPEGHFEIATFRRDGPYEDGRHPVYVEFRDEKEDALRRDFTINALFLDPETEGIVDYVEGQADLRAGVVRAVGDPRARFREDHLRLLRAVRFAARLNYAVDPGTRAAITELAPLIRETSAERVRDEIAKMLTEGGARRAFELMDETGVLAEVLPEIARMKGVEQPPEYHPEGDVFIHTMILLGKLASPSVALAFGALLHDVGKPLTQTFEDRIRFNLHDKVGAREAAAICRRLRMSGDESERIVWLVEQHMRVATAPEMRVSKLKRLVREEGFPELLELFRIDCLSSHGDLGTHAWLRDYAAGLSPDEARPEPLITGRDLIAMGYAPGPRFKEMLRAVEDAQLERALATPEAAAAFVRERWPATGVGTANPAGSAD